MSGWLLVIYLAGGGVRHLGPMPDRVTCEYARQDILHADRAVRSARCVPNYER